MKQQLLFIVLLALLFPSVGHAQDGDLQKFSIGENMPDPEDPENTIPYVPPNEPNIPPVKFLKEEPPASLRQRIDYLIHGIKIDIPPEYDIYGYELRRYMAHVGNSEIFSDGKKLEEELSNVRKAKIIFKYWQEDLLKRISDIQKTIDSENASSEIRTGFKYNSGLATAFLSECGTWLDKNEKVLEFLMNKKDSYTFVSPDFIFNDISDRDKFAAIYIEAQQARKYINEYVPFSGMVY